MDGRTRLVAENDFVFSNFIKEGSRWVLLDMDATHYSILCTDGNGEHRYLPRDIVKKNFIIKEPVLGTN